jgi:hypothetical protein
MPLRFDEVLTGTGIYNLQVFSLSKNQTFLRTSDKKQFSKNILLIQVWLGFVFLNGAFFLVKKTTIRKNLCVLYQSNKKQRDCSNKLLVINTVY